MNVNSRSLHAGKILLSAWMCAAAPAMAQTVRTWNGGNGLWEDDTNWTPNGAPEGAEYSAIVDSGAGAGAGWTATRLAGTVGRLRVGPRDRVVMGGSNFLTNSAGFTGAGVLDIGGVLQLAGAGMEFSTDATLTGGGAIELGDPVNNGVLALAGTHQLINQNLRIHGNGQILMDIGNAATAGNFLNRGVVRAETSKFIQITGGYISNFGEISAASDGYLALTATHITGSANSFVERFAGGLLECESMTFAGETLRSAAAGGGWFNLLNCNLDGEQRRIQTNGLFKINGGFNLVTGSIENKGELRFQMIAAGGGYQGFFVRDANNAATTFTGGGTVDFPPGANYTNHINSDPYTPGIQTIANVDNTFSGGGNVVFQGVHFRNEAAGKLIANRPGESISFPGSNQTGVDAEIVNAGYLGAENGGHLVIQRRLITIGAAAVTGVSGNGLITHDGATFAGGKLVNSNTSFHVVTNRGIELIGDTLLAGLPFPNGTPDPVSISGYVYARDIELLGEIRAANGLGSGTIQNAGRIEISRDIFLGNPSLNGMRVFLLDDEIGSCYIGAMDPVGDSLSLTGGSFMAGDGTIAVSMIIFPGSFLEAAGGTLNLNTTTRHGETAVIYNRGRIEAANNGVLFVANEIVNVPEAGLPALSSGAIVSFGSSKVNVYNGKVSGGVLHSQRAAGGTDTGDFVFEYARLENVAFSSENSAGEIAGYFRSATGNTLAGTIRNDTTLIVQDGDASTSTTLFVDGVVSLRGAGQLIFQNSGGSLPIIIGVDGPGGTDTLIQDPGHTLTGSASIQVAFINNGKVVVGGGESATFAGTVSGSGNYRTQNGQIVFERPVGLTNRGAGVLAAGTQGQITVPSIQLSNGAGVVAMGGGNIVGTNAGAVVAMGGGNVVAMGGGNVVAMGGNNVVAMGGGNVVAMGGGNVVANGGGNVVAMGGGNLVGLNGSNVVAMGGGNIVGTNAGAIIGVRNPRDGDAAGVTRVLLGDGSTFTAGVIEIQTNAVLEITAGDPNADPENFVLPPDTISYGNVVGTFDLQTGGAWVADIGGTVAGQTYDQLTVTGAALLDGELRVRMLNNFQQTITSANTFTILTATEGITGLPSNTVNGRITTIDQFGTFALNITAGGTALVLSDFQPLPHPILAWAAGFGLTGADAQMSADPDRDGRNNLEEFAYLTSPVNGGNMPNMPIERVGDQFVISFTRRCGASHRLSYTAESTANLTNWLPLAAPWTQTITPLTSETETVTITGPVSAVRTLFHMTVTGL